MKTLAQTSFTLELVSDLGSRPIGGFRSDSGIPRTARFVLLKCTCGALFETRCDIGKKAKSCRTCATKCAGTKHGQSSTRLYSIWQNMLRRESHNPEYYKGISIAKEWQTFNNFYIWASTSGYSNGLEIDRVDNTKGYEPKNCRWTTRQVQGRNTRRLFKHNTTGYRGVAYCKSRTSIRKYFASLKINNRAVRLGWFIDAISAAKAYDTYVVLHNLEHTINGVLHEPIQPTGTP